MAIIIISKQSYIYSKIYNKAIYTATVQEHKDDRGLLNYHKKWCSMKRFQILKEMTQSPQETLSLIHI